MGTGDLVRLVLWFGIISGLIEVALLAAIKLGSLASAPAGWASPDERLRHNYVWLSVNVVWMAPLAMSVILALPAALLAAGGRFSDQLRSIRVVSAVLAFVCFASLLNIYPRLYAVAVVVLAAGLGVQFGRVADSKRAQFLGLVRRTYKWLSGLVVLVAFVMLAGGFALERHRLSNLPEPPSEAPNILLLILDTVRASNLSVYGYSKETTPNLVRLASEGVTFEMAISTSPWTLPSHVSIFTGTLPYEQGVNFLIPYDGRHTTLAEVLVKLGYETSGFVGNLVYCTDESGITEGFVHYDAHRLIATEFLKSTALGRRLEQSRLLHRLVSYYDVFGNKDAAEVTNEFISWLDDRNTDPPFFAFLNYMDAHEPYLPPARYVDRFGTGTERRNDLNTYFIRWAARPGRQLMSAEEIHAEEAAYDGTIAYVDEQIGVLLDRLRDEDILQNTLVIVAADHGEQFGEHGLHVHGNSLFLPNLHVPLLVAYGDRLPGGTRIGAPVSLRDIPATVLSLSGLGGDNTFPGQSLERFWSDTEDDSGASEQGVFSELTDIRGAPTTKSLVVGRYHYIWGENRIEALFDIESDPGELTSLMTRENLELVTRMRRLMAPRVRNDTALWERLPQHD